MNRDQQEFWINRAGDALGRFAAEGGEVIVVEAQNGEELTTLIAVGHEYQGPLVAAISRGRLMQRVGVGLSEEGAETSGEATP